MDHLEDSTTLAIARRIRVEREVRGWSLSDLAAHSAVSKAAISKIERGEVSPTATVLVKLAGAFDLTLAGLLLRAEESGARLVRAAAQPVWRDSPTGYIRRQVFMRPDHPVEIAEIRLPAGQQVTMPASSYAHIRQVVWVTAGSLTVSEGGERHDLEVGDSLGFGAPAEVIFANRSGSPCTYLVTLART